LLLLPRGRKYDCPATCLEQESKRANAGHPEAIRIVAGHHFKGELGLRQDKAEPQQFSATTTTTDYTPSCRLLPQHYQASLMQGSFHFFFTSYLLLLFDMYGGMMKYCRRRCWVCLHASRAPHYVQEEGWKAVQEDHRFPPLSLNSLFCIVSVSIKTFLLQLQTYHKHKFH